MDSHILILNFSSYELQNHAYSSGSDHFCKCLSIVGQKRREASFGTFSVGTRNTLSVFNHYSKKMWGLKRLIG